MSFVDELNHYNEPAKLDNSHIAVNRIIGALQDQCIKKREQHQV